MIDFDPKYWDGSHVKIVDMRPRDDQFCRVAFEYCGKRMEKTVRFDTIEHFSNSLRRMGREAERDIISQHPHVYEAA